MSAMTQRWQKIDKKLVQFFGEVLENLSSFGKCFCHFSLQRINVSGSKHKKSENCKTCWHPHVV